MGYELGDDRRMPAVPKMCELSLSTLALLLSLCRLRTFCTANKHNSHFGRGSLTRTFADRHRVSLPSRPRTRLHAKSATSAAAEPAGAHASFCTKIILGHSNPGCHKASRVRDTLVPHAQYPEAWKPHGLRPTAGCSKKANNASLSRPTALRREQVWDTRLIDVVAQHEGGKERPPKEIVLSPTDRPNVAWPIHSEQTPQCLAIHGN